MTALVRIYLLQRGVDVYRWLCTRCLKSLEDKGWEVRSSRDPHPGVTLGCDGEECWKATEAA